MRLQQSHERTADVIVDAIKENIIYHGQLAAEIAAAEAHLRDLKDKIDGRERHGRLLETNLKRALIQEIEAEVV